MKQSFALIELILKNRKHFSNPDKIKKGVAHLTKKMFKKDEQFLVGMFCKIISSLGKDAFETPTKVVTQYIQSMNLVKKDEIKLVL